MKIIAIYKIEYTDRGITQYKNLISHKDYLNEIVPLLTEINNIDQTYKKRQADKLKYPLKKRIEKEFGKQYFTDKSPLFDAIATGILEINNKKFPVKITQYHQPDS